MSVRLNHIIGIVAVSLLAVSCVKDVILDARDEPQVVVECILSDEPVQTLYLSYTKGASREAAPELTEAVATLTDLTEGREAGRFRRADDGSWQLSYAAVPAHEYRLDVTVPDHEPIWAEQTMPEVPMITSRWKPWQLSDYPKYLDDHGFIYSITAPKDPVWFYGINYPTADSPGEMASLLCTDYRYVDEFNIDVSSGIQGYTTRDIESKFWGSSWFRFTTYPDLEGRPLHTQLLRFPAKEDLYKTDFIISGTFQGYISSLRDFAKAEKRPAELHYFSASEDYDRYLKDTHHLLGLKASTDMADIFVRDNIYSNIQGAIGLFGAKVENKTAWDWTEEALGAHGLLFFPGFAEVNDNWCKENGVKYLVHSANVFRYMAQNEWSITPFELLEYEVLLDTIPDWAPEPPPSSHAFRYAYTAYIIQDEGQLKEVGLGDCGPIDFSNKTVLLVNYREDGQCRLPICIAQGVHGRIETRIITVPYPNATSANIRTGAFRIAILIDKEDNTNFIITNYFQPTEDYSDLIYQAFWDLSGKGPEN